MVTVDDIVKCYESKKGQKNTYGPYNLFVKVECRNIYKDIKKQGKKPEISKIRVELRNKWDNLNDKEKQKYEEASKVIQSKNNFVKLTTKQKIEEIKNRRDKKK